VDGRDDDMIRVGGENVFREMRPVGVPRTCPDAAVIGVAI